MPTSEPAAGAGIEVVVKAGKTYWWCRCGLSKAQPFCDGSHKGTAFEPMRYTPAESGPNRFCVCKRTTTPPLCDHVDHDCAALAQAAT